jgi:hypothetical protein
MRLLRKILNAAKEYEQHLQDQKFVSKQFLSIRNMLTSNINKPVPVEFFFYSDNEEDAKLISADLQKAGYEVYGIDPSKDKFSIIGATTPINVNGKEFVAWIDKMNQLAFLYNCMFDGYGMLIEE